MDPILASAALVAVGIAFFVSASAGLGGSLVMVPALSLILGTKEGVALSALLLASNNIVKVLAYRASVPWKAASAVIIATMTGALLGARLLIAAPENVVTVAVIASFAAALLAERWTLRRAQWISAPGLAVASGATSGFSGTSGPLKGIAIRQLELDRMHFVGAASVVSLFGDVSKVAVFSEAGLLGRQSLTLAVGAVPLMFLATFAGRRLNYSLGERGYQHLFWSVMTGYSARLIFSL